jgi:hypothetical protein
MKQSFTSTQLIKFLYRETSLSETLAISEALENDPLLSQEMDELTEACQQLPNVKFSPSPDTIRSILAYSEERTVEPQH